jgi:hypothetical protein
MPNSCGTSKCELRTTLIEECPPVKPDANAVLRIGNLTTLKDRVAKEDVALMLEKLVFNVRYALRHFGRNRTHSPVIHREFTGNASAKGGPK